ncbi:hypothetical protein KM043_017145 [Ampulex compressa]|nr:hypothetical protein KM043_017145 [Ampulex compressa]
MWKKLIRIQEERNSCSFRFYYLMSLSAPADVSASGIIIEMRHPPGSGHVLLLRQEGLSFIRRNSAEECKGGPLGKRRKMYIDSTRCFLGRSTSRRVLSFPPLLRPFLLATPPPRAILRCLETDGQIALAEQENSLISSYKYERRLATSGGTLRWNAEVSIEMP